MSKSLFEKLNQNEKIPFHMPGHKRNTKAFPFFEKLGAKYDITEIDGFDNLHNAEGILKNSMDSAAKLWGAKQSFFLVNGSSGGILAAINSVIKHGDRVICARNCHKSVYNALKIAGARIHFINPEYDEKIGIFTSVSPKSIKCAIEKFGDVRLVIITSPTYEGILSDVSAICKEAHKFNIPVLVDEAHGAHLSFGSFEKGAVKSGADIVVQSLHKTLASLTQTAILHICSDRINPLRIKEELSVFQTSSPSYLFLSSIDFLVREIENNKNDIFKTWEDSLDFFYKKCGNLKNLEIMSEKSNCFFARDKSKILILTYKTAISGNELSKILRLKYNIECEMSSAKFVVAMTGMGDTDISLKKLADALCDIDLTLTQKKCDEVFLFPKSFKAKMTLQSASSSDFCPCDTQNSVGNICAEYIFAYPPGIPLIIPGEEITSEILKIFENYTSNGIELIGSRGGGSQKINIICQNP